MSKRTANNLFILPSMPRLYQQLLTGVASYEALGKRIIGRLKVAHAFRQIEHVRELSKILINIPIKEYRLIAQYYLIWCDCRKSKYDIEFLEKIIEQTQTYKTKALFSRGAIEWFKGRPEVALRFYGEALKTTPSISEYIDLSRSIAVLKATEGFHRSALKDLENLLPIIKYGEPLAYYEALNSYAVELNEAGRKYEARNISRIVINSPFAFAYPEWCETGQELALRGYKSRSVVSVLKPVLDSNNVVPMPVVERSPDPPQQGRAKLFDLKKWAKKMGKKPNGDEKTEDLENMDEKDLMVKLMYLATDERLTENKLRKLIQYALQVLSEPSEPED